MTKEEVAQIITYCDENKISYKQRLSGLGINPGSFYDAKRKYAPKQDACSFLLEYCMTNAVMSHRRVSYLSAQ